MLRVFAIVAVLGAFGATLYFSGDYLQAWEAPEPSAKAAPAPPEKKKAKAKAMAKAKHPARKVKKRAGRESEPAWLIELNAFCIRVLDDSVYAFDPPSRPEDVPRYIRRFERWNARMNRRMLELVQRSGDAKAAKTLRRLKDQEEQLAHSMLTAAQNGDGQGMRKHMRSLLAVAKLENSVLTRLGSVDCTLEPDAFELY
jgi:hypothetical protein